MKYFVIFLVLTCFAVLVPHAFGMPFPLLSPLKQFNSGIVSDEIQCKESLSLVTKYDGSPACVKPETKQKLIERGWAISKNLD